MKWNNKSYPLLCGVIILTLMLNGCALLQVPVKVVEGSFSLVRELLKIVNKLPKPPPGVF